MLYRHVIFFLKVKLRTDEVGSLQETQAHDACTVCDSDRWGREGPGFSAFFFLCVSNESVREVTADFKGVHTLKKVTNHWTRWICSHFVEIWVQFLCSVDSDSQILNSIEIWVQFVFCIGLESEGYHYDDDYVGKGKCLEKLYWIKILLNI